MFHYNLSSDGVLFLGNSETIGDTSAFTCINNKRNQAMERVSDLEKEP